MPHSDCAWRYPGGRRPALLRLLSFAWVVLAVLVSCGRPDQVVEKRYEAAFVDQQSLSPTVSVGESAPVSVKFRNTGTATWQRGTPSEARLGVADEDQTFAGLGMADGWLQPTRPAAQAEPAVAPRQVATFVFRVKGVRAGAFTLWVQPVIGDTRIGRAVPLEFEVQRSAPVRIIVEPAERSLRVGQSIAFSARAYDVEGELIPDLPVTWLLPADGGWCRQCGTMSSTGVFKAVAPDPNGLLGRVLVQANAEGIKGQALVTILRRDLQVLAPGQSSRAAKCGSGATADRVTLTRFPPPGPFLVGGEMPLEAHPLAGSALGVTTVVWTLQASSSIDMGRLLVSGCSALYQAPSSIGSAYQTSVTVVVKLGGGTASPSPVASSGGAGEGGPVFVDTSRQATASILIYDPRNGPPACDSVHVIVETNGDWGQVLWVQYGGRVFYGSEAYVTPGLYTFTIYAQNGAYTREQVRVVCPETIVRAPS